MNFPGLDPLWSGAHRAAHQLGFLPTFSLEQCQTALGQGARVLVVAPTALGDSLLTTPLIETLAQRLGPDRVSLLVKEPYADLYRHDPRLHRLLTVRGKYRWQNLRKKLAADPHRVALIANTTEPDLIPLLWWSGVRGFLRYRTRWSRYPSWMANRAMMRPPGTPGYATGHAIENNLAMVEALGFAPATHKLSMPHLRSEPGSREQVVLIHPGASRENKRWPRENWAAVADALAGRLGCAIAFTGSAGEIGLADAIIVQMKSPAQNLAGTLSLSALARLQSRSLAFLSGDTGPYHLAVAVGCPTVTLFAPTDRGSSIEACGPHQADPRHHRALQTENPGDSIATIAPERMLQVATELLAS